MELPVYIKWLRFIRPNILAGNNHIGPPCQYRAPTLAQSDWPTCLQKSGCEGVLQIC